MLIESVLFYFTFCPQSKPDRTGLIEQLNRIGVAETSVDAEQKLNALGSSSEDFRSVISDRLPNMLLGAGNPEVVRWEALLAGSLRLDSTIAALVTLLGRDNKSAPPGRNNINPASLLDDPVAKSLLTMGPAAVPQLAKSIRADLPTTRIRTTRILLLMGTDQALSILNVQRSRETDPAVQEVIDKGKGANSTN